MDLLRAAFEHSPDALMIVQAEADGAFRFHLPTPMASHAAFSV